MLKKQSPWKYAFNIYRIDLHDPRLVRTAS